VRPGDESSQQDESEDEPVAARREQESTGRFAFEPGVAWKRQLRGPDPNHVGVWNAPTGSGFLRSLLGPDRSGWPPGLREMAALIAAGWLAVAARPSQQPGLANRSAWMRCRPLAAA